MHLLLNKTKPFNNVFEYKNQYKKLPSFVYTGNKHLENKGKTNH